MLPAPMAGLPMKLRREVTLTLLPDTRARPVISMAYQGSGVPAARLVKTSRSLAGSQMAALSPPVAPKKLLVEISRVPLMAGVLISNQTICELAPTRKTTWVGVWAWRVVVRRKRAAARKYFMGGVSWG